MNAGEVENIHLLPIASNSIMTQIKREDDVFSHHSVNEQGYCVYMCPSCFYCELAIKEKRLSFQVVLSTRGAKTHPFCNTTVDLFCEKCNELRHNWIELDPNIASAIRMLNLKGIKLITVVKVMDERGWGMFLFNPSIKYNLI